MSSKHILVTGGAGFIGQRVARSLLKLGHEVCILDNFSPQIHSSDLLPDDLKHSVLVLKGDVRDRSLLRSGIRNAKGVIHLAAETGTGQSMYEIDRYFSVNVQGTAVLLDILQNEKSAASVESIVVASSRAIYGEGSYSCETHGIVYPETRTNEQMTAGQFEPVCPICYSIAKISPTLEIAPFKPMSIYGLTKQIQEQAFLMYARTRGINGFGLRYQNVYGPGQSLKNPYTGILAVFSNLARQNQDIEIYEDGNESRDFVYIDDVVEATIRSISYASKFIGALNVGSGQATSVKTVAEEIIKYFSSTSQIHITGAFRVGDIRHNIADVTELQRVLGFVPGISFKDGLAKFLSWASQQAPEDKAAYLRSVGELQSRGLMGQTKVQ